MADGGSDFRARVKATEADRARTRRLVADGRWRDADSDPRRVADLTARTAAFMAPRGAEAVQGDTLDYQPVSFLPIGTRVQRAVGYVEVMLPGESCSGSGFLISPDLFITNQHVIGDAAAARGAQVVFDRQADASGRPAPTTTFLLDPDRCALFSAENVLDYAVVAVGARASGAAALADLGFCPLSNRPDKHALGMNVNIIQHPNGAPKLIAVRNNLLTARTDTTLLYETDTDHGSSGAPVFNDLWEVVALHHYGAPFLEKTDENGRQIPSNVNEGVRISRIYQDLAARLAALDGEAKRLVAAALDYDRQAPSFASGDRTLGPPRPPSKAAEAAPLGAPPMSVDAGRELKVVIPIEVTLRVGAGAAAPAAGSVVEGAAAPSKTLVRSAEKLKIDADYSNRGGYKDDFIPGVQLPTPAPDATLAKQIAPLRAGEDDAAAGLLRYEHFSVLLNKSRRVAMFTATNIDGTAYLNVDRKTGKVTEGAEGETWFNDPRVSSSFYLDQTFYTAWADYFDRGHLTRRTDPNWGTDEEAERGNADTYHFTNCSPQHFLFNQSSKYWQGVERYVLEQGALAPDSLARLCVFQGPIYTDSLDRMADDVQVPSSFFKVVVWKGHAGLRAVGLTVDQLALLDRRRSAGRQPSEAEVQVNQWRVAIPDIARRTGLSFPQAVVDADTIAAAAQPVVGAERALLLTSLDDIRL